MPIIKLTVDERAIIQGLLRQKVLAVDVPESDASSGHLPLRSISSIRLTCEGDNLTFFSVKSVDLDEGVEVFLLDIIGALDLKHYPGGPPIKWHPLVELTEELRGSIIEDVRLLSAGWQVMTGTSVEGTYYGKRPLSLTYDLSDDAATYHVEDGIILFFSDESILILSATGDLSGTLKFWHSKA